MKKLKISKIWGNRRLFIWFCWRYSYNFIL